MCHLVYETPTKSYQIAVAYFGIPGHVTTKHRHALLGSGAAVPILGELSPHLTILTQWPWLRPTSVSSGIDPWSCLATTDMSQNWGSEPFFWGGELGPHLTQCRLGRGLPPYQVASSSIQPIGHNTPMSQTQDRTVRQTKVV